MPEAEAEDFVVWLEGKSGGPSPLRQECPLTNPLAAGNVLGDV